MKIKEVAKLSKLTVRTLHHYDAIGLLSPEKNDENNYRIYSEKDIDRLQQIMFFKACGFSLKDIKNILDNPSFNKQEALNLQKKYLEEEISRINKMIKNITKSQKNYKRGIKMNNEEKFEGFDFSKNPYEEEAKKLYGKKTVEESQKYMKEKGEKWGEQVGEELSNIFKEFNKKLNLPKNGEDVQTTVKRLYDFLNENFNVEYTLEAFNSIGQMYISDKRFTKNIDKFGEGTADFVAKSIEVYVKNNS